MKAIFNKKRNEIQLVGNGHTSHTKVNLPAAGGHVHGRFASVNKPTCRRWVFTRDLCARR